MEKIRIGLIGTGGICNGVHIPGYEKCPECEITAICDISEKALTSTGDRLGIPSEHRFRDYRDLLASGLVDAVDIATSDDFHVEIAMAALDAGLPVSVEKPIGRSFDESLALAQKSKETGLPVFVCFSMRYNNYVRRMKDIVQSGQLGDLYHIYIRCLKDSALWEGRRMSWRFRAEKASSGVLSDLGSHMYDIVRFIGQEVEAVYCNRGTTIHQRMKEDSDEWETVTTDDWCNVLCTLESGIDANISISRATLTEKDTRDFYILGSKGSVRYLSDLDSQKLLLCAGDDIKTASFQDITDTVDQHAVWQSRSYIDLLLGHPDQYAATIEAGLGSQVVIDAAKRSDAEKRQVLVSEMYGGTKK